MRTSATTVVLISSALAAALATVGIIGCPRKAAQKSTPTASPQVTVPPTEQPAWRGTIAFIRIEGQEPNASASVWTVEAGRAPKQIVPAPSGQWLDHLSEGPAPGTLLLHVIRNSHEPAAAQFDIAECDIATGKLTSITTSGQAAYPVWCPTKQRTFFVRMAGSEARSLASISQDGADQLVVWQPESGEPWTPVRLTCDPHGHWLAVTDTGTGSATAVMFVDTIQQKALWAWEGQWPEPLQGISVPEGLHVTGVVWSHDGKRIVLLTERAEEQQTTASLIGPAFCVTVADKQVVHLLDKALAAAWSPDDSRIVLAQSVSGPNSYGSRLMLISPAGGEPELLVDDGWRPAWCTNP